jgi:hypothetical protein
MGGAIKAPPCQSVRPNTCRARALLHACCTLAASPPASRTPRTLACPIARAHLSHERLHAGRCEAAAGGTGRGRLWADLCNLRV